MRRLTISLLAVAGTAALVVGALQEDGTYSQGLLLNMGTGVLLFAVLYMVQLRVLDRVEEVETQTQDSVRALNRDVNEVREAVRSTEARLGELGGQTRDILGERLKATTEAFDDFAANVSCETTLTILGEAARVGGISRKGVRVGVPDARCWLRFQGLSGALEPATGEGESRTINGVWLVIEEMDGTRLRDLLWQAPESAAEVMVKLAEHLQQLGQYPGDSRFLPDEIFAALREVLQIAIGVRTRTRPFPGDLGPLIEAPNAQWAITEYGLECLERSYQIPKERFREDWNSHMATKSWIDMDQFSWAFAIASSLLWRDPDGPAVVSAARH